MSQFKNFDFFLCFAANKIWAYEIANHCKQFYFFILYRITTFMELRFCILYTFQNTLKTRDK